MISLLCIEWIRTHRHDQCFLLSKELKIASDDVYLMDDRTRERERERERVTGKRHFNSQDQQIEHCLAELDAEKQIAYRVICVD
jgi:hypothetical protein